MRAKIQRYMDLIEQIGKMYQAATHVFSFAIGVLRTIFDSQDALAGTSDVTRSALVTALLGIAHVLREIFCL